MVTDRCLPNGSIHPWLPLRISGGVTVLLLAMWSGGCSKQPSGSDPPLGSLFATSPATARGTEERWEAALVPRRFRFPADHAAHEDYRIEWWYYTGNLESADGRRFGYQLTFFRTGLHKAPVNPSRWAVRDLYTAHFAVSDVRSKKHYCLQRTSRQGLGQAGALVESYRVWNGDWKAWLDGEQHRLQAHDANVAIDLTLTPPRRPPVLHGDGGLSQKGATAGNASYYYSFTRMPTTGQVRIGGKAFSLTGTSWMDHEFSTSFLEAGQLGWDWMAIQLDSGVDLMIYRMRRTDGSTDPYSSGSLIEAETVRHLSATQYEMTPLRTWNSARTGASYPLDWRVVIPSLQYELEIVPAFDAQEMVTADTTGINYWEGAIDVTGRGPHGSLTGRGYMELTGYAGQGLGTLFDQ